MINIKHPLTTGFLILSMTLFSMNVFAKPNGYKITFHISNCGDTALQLCHFEGKPSFVEIVSTKTFAKGTKDATVVFENDAKIISGIYMALFKYKRSQLDFILQNGDELDISYDFTKPTETAIIKGSSICLDYLAYQHYLAPFNEKFKQADAERKAAKNKTDSTSARDKIDALSKEIENYRQNYINKHPGNILSKLYKAASVVEFPKQIKGNEEQEKAYLRKHMWENFDFLDDRLVYTPFLEGKLETYLNIHPPIPDTINAAMDDLLKKMEKSPAQTRFATDWFVKAMENAKVQFGDDCFIHLVENYYLNGKATWAKDSAIKSYQKKILLLSKNVIGAKAPDMDILNKNDQAVSLAATYTKHKYTMLMFWSPTCNHCTTEIPMIDSALASLKKDIAVIGIDAHGEGEEWKKFIDTHTWQYKWEHWYDPQKKGNYVSNYSVYTTPVLYLIDRKGIIVAKRLTHENIKSVLEDLEKK